MTDNYYDREYDPKNRIANFADYFTRWKGASLEAREQLTGQLDISYGPSDDETLDYFPASQAGAPLLIFLHGGYWRSFHKDDFSWIAPAYVAAGISVSVVNYSLAPQVTLPAMVEQVRRSVLWLHSNSLRLGHDPARIVCSGHSAGGHLTAMMLVTNWADLNHSQSIEPIRAAIGISGLYDLEPISKTEFLKPEISLDTETISSMSPVKLTPSGQTPLLTVVGQQESSEFHRQSQMLVDCWGNSITQGPLDIGGANHFDVCDEFVNENSELFRLVCSFCEA